MLEHWSDDEAFTGSHCTVYTSLQSSRTAAEQQQPQLQTQQMQKQDGSILMTSPLCESGNEVLCSRPSPIGVNTSRK